MENTSTYKPKVRVTLHGRDSVRNKFYKCAEDFEQKTKPLAKRDSIETASNTNDAALLVALDTTQKLVSGMKGRVERDDVSPWNPEHYTQRDMNKNFRTIEIYREGGRMLTLTHAVSKYYNTLADAHEGVLHSNVSEDLLLLYQECMDLVCDACLEMYSGLDIEYFMELFHDNRPEFRLVSMDMQISRDCSISTLKTMARHISIKNNQLVALVGDDIAKQHGLQDKCNSVSESLQKLINNLSGSITSSGPKSPISTSELSNGAENAYVEFAKSSGEACSKKLEQKNILQQDKKAVTGLQNELEQLHKNVVTTFAGVYGRCNAAKTWLDSPECHQLKTCAVKDLEQRYNTNQQQGGAAI